SGGTQCPPSCSGTRRCANGQCVNPIPWAVLIEDPFTKCGVGLPVVNAVSSAEAIGCVQLQNPGLLAGIAGGNFTYLVSCPDGMGGTINTTVSNVIALSRPDGQACVQSQFGGCTVA